MDEIINEGLDEHDNYEEIVLENEEFKDDILEYSTNFENIDSLIEIQQSTLNILIVILVFICITLGVQLFNVAFKGGKYA